ncbi:MAG: D-alanine--D-alanine ligase family protein [Rhodoluna sp.]
MIPKAKAAAKLKIQILAGGISHEREVSLKSGRRVADALTDAGASVVIREPDAALLANIRKDKPDVIWPVLHGASGEDGALRDILALTGVPFVGATAQGARLAWDKSIAKILVEREGVQTPASITLPKDTFRELDAEGVLKTVAASLALPVVVKPAKSGSAQGVTIVRKADQLSRAMIDAYVYCDVAIIERYVEGTELAISIIDLGAGPIALPAVEIQPVAGQFGYQERYTAGETNYFVPARIKKTVAERAANMAIAVHEILGLRHLSRIDMIVDNKGVAWFLEANVLPGLTETSLLPQAVTAAGHSLGEVYLNLAQAAIRNR